MLPYYSGQGGATTEAAVAAGLRSVDHGIVGGVANAEDTRDFGASPAQQAELEQLASNKQVSTQALEKKDTEIASVVLFAC